MGSPISLSRALPDRKCRRRLRLATLALLLLANAAAARTAQQAWNNLCEQCHGEVETFAEKYLWYIDGQLQGRHHVDDLHLFMSSHYIPDHEVEGMRQKLSGMANTPARFERACGDCHGEVQAFVDKSIWVKKKGMTAINAGMEVEDFLQTHENIPAADIDYYLRLFVRMARNR